MRLEGERLTVTTRTTQVVFRAGEIIRLTNRMTGEDHVNVRSAQPPLFDMPIQGWAGRPLRCDGWRQGKTVGANADAAQTQLTDLTRTITLNVIAEQATGDVVLEMRAVSSRPGVLALRWGMRGLDLSSGRLVLPALGGVWGDRTNLPASLGLSYPGEWQALLAAWQCRAGGFVVYSQEKQPGLRGLVLSRRGDFGDLAFEARPTGHPEKATDVALVEWRINCYRGDWRVPAAGYRRLMNELRPPLPAQGPRAWVTGIRTVATVPDVSQASTLSELARILDPSRTLLYLPAWRRGEPLDGIPEFRPRDGVREFVRAAKEAGFRVMLHVEVGFVRETDAEPLHLGRALFSPAESRHPAAPRIALPSGHPARLAAVSLADAGYRALLRSRLAELLDTLRPDALHLAGLGAFMPARGTVIGDDTEEQGAITLCRALLSLQPHLALSGDTLTEGLHPYLSFASAGPPRALAPHPIGTMLFGDRTLRFADRLQPDPDVYPSAWTAYLRLTEGAGVSPTPIVSTPSTHRSETSLSRQLLDLAQAWQKHGLRPEWNTDWGDAGFRWRGEDGTPAAAGGTGFLRELRVGERVYFRRISGARGYAGASAITAWPARAGSAAIGLDPQREYWLGGAPADDELPSLSTLPPGAVVQSLLWSQGLVLAEISTAEAGLIALAAGEHGARWKLLGKEAQSEGAADLSRTCPAGVSVFGAYRGSAAALAGSSDLLSAPWRGFRVDGPFVLPSDGLVEVVRADPAEANRIRGILLRVDPGGGSAAAAVLHIPSDSSARLVFSVEAAGRAVQASAELRINGGVAWSAPNLLVGRAEGVVDTAAWRGQVVAIELRVLDLGEGEPFQVRWMGLHLAP